jgi:hypothetical protein
MVSEKKDLWYIKVLANGILYLYMCPLTDVACGVKWVVGLPYDNAPSGVCTLMEEEEERRIL